MQIINNVIDSIYPIYQDVIYPLNKHSLLFYSIYFFIFFFIYFIHTSKTSINIFSDYIEKYKNNKKFLKIFYGITCTIIILLIGGLIYSSFHSKQKENSYSKSIIICTFIFVIFFINYMVI